VNTTRFGRFFSRGIQSSPSAGCLADRGCFEVPENGLIAMASLGRLVGAYDYLIGGWLILLPWLFRFNDFLVPTIVSVAIGLGIIVNSLFSNIESGLIRFIPRYVHHLTDLITGFLLCVAPWLLRYHEIIFWPHVVTGFLYIILTLSIGKRSRRHYLN